MSTQINRLTDEQNRVWTRMQDIRDAAERDGRDLTAEERSNWDAAETRLTEIRSDVERYERMARLEAVERSIPTQAVELRREEVKPEADYRETFLNYVRRGMSNLSAEQRSALMQNHSEVRAAATSPGSAGGFLIPTATLNRMTETMKAFGGILGVANVITTETGNPVNWPSNDATAQVGGILGENSAVSETDVTFGQKTLGAFTYSSNLTRVSLQLLQDNVFDVEGWLSRKLGERIGRAVAAHLATGTGTTQPEGLFTNINTGKTGTTGQTTSIIYDDLVDLIHSVDPAYRGNARFVMADSSLKVVRKLKDSQGHPLWEPSVQAGVPDTLLGYPVTIDQGAPAMAANAKSIAFGDIASAYVVRQVAGGQLLRLDERYADFLQVGFLAFLRLDAKPDDAAAVRAYVNSAT